MAVRNWLRDYDRAVQADLRAGLLQPAEATEQRRHPRLEVAGMSVRLGVGSGLHLISLDRDIAEFYSGTEMQPGRRLTLRLDDAAELPLEVRACRMEETDPATLEVLYRVEARVLPDAARHASQS